jgi:hypothetical protein
MRTMIERRDADLTETVGLLRNQLDSMAEEVSEILHVFPSTPVLIAVPLVKIAWEKRRGIAQLLLLLVVIGLSALSRSATVDVQTVRPLLRARNSIAAELKRNEDSNEILRRLVSPEPS